MADYRMFIRIGKNLAETLLSEGEQVVVTARKPETIQHFAEKYPQTALCLRLDVTKKDTIDSAIKEAIEKFGKIDVLINNAGYCLRGAVEECTEEEIYAEFNTNFFGAVRMIPSHEKKPAPAPLLTIPRLPLWIPLPVRLFTALPSAR